MYVWILHSGVDNHMQRFKIWTKCKWILSLATVAMVWRACDKDRNTTMMQTIMCLVAIQCNILYAISYTLNLSTVTVFYFHELVVEWGPEKGIIPKNLFFRHCRAVLNIYWQATLLCKSHGCLFMKLNIHTMVQWSQFAIIIHLVYVNISLLILPLT